MTDGEIRVVAKQPKTRRFAVEDERGKVVYTGESTTDIITQARKLYSSGAHRGVCAVMTEPNGTRIIKHMQSEMGVKMPQALEGDDGG